MKLIFFLIAFCLITVRYYFSWSGVDKQRKGVSESNMVIESDHFYESIHYSGKFRLLDDETGFKSISPGGYFKFRQDDLRVEAESNFRGEIEYKIENGSSKLNAEADRQMYIAMAIKEMIAWGYDADARMERVYQKQGVAGLLNEVDSMKPEQIKLIYLNRLFAIEPLSPDTLSLVVKKIESLGSDMEKARLISRVNENQFKNPLISTACFNILSRMQSDMDKKNVLQQILDHDSLTMDQSSVLLHIAGSLQSNMDKADLYRKMIEKHLIEGALTDSLIVQVSQIGSDMDKSGLYRSLLTIKPMADSQWINLLNEISTIGSDMDKANTLLEVYSVMPKTDLVIATYRKSAKTIGDNNEYGKVIRVLN